MRASLVSTLSSILVAAACVDRPIGTDGSDDDVGDDSSSDTDTSSTDTSSTDTSSTDTSSTETGSDGDPPDPCDPIVFEDPQLEARVRSELSLAEGDVLDAATMATLSSLYLPPGTFDSLVGLECATGLVSFDASFNQISDLEPLSELPLLEVLDVRSNSITTLPSLASTPVLRDVSLALNPVTDVSALAGAFALEHLHLGQTHVSDLDPLADAGQLRLLFASETPLSDLEFVTGLTELETLDVDSTQITDLGPLTGLPKLSQLEIGNNDILDLAPVATLPSLTSLSMYDTGQPDLSVLAGLPIEVLDATGNGIVDVTPVTTFTPVEMKHLDLSDNAITDLSPFADTVWMGSGCGVQLGLEGNPVAASPTLVEDYPYICELGMFTIWNSDESLYCGDGPCP